MCMDLMCMQDAHKGHAWFKQNRGQIQFFIKVHVLCAWATTHGSRLNQHILELFGRLMKQIGWAEIFVATEYKPI